MTAFYTPLPVLLFSQKPQAFRASLETVDTTYQQLQFEVPPGLGGNYTFYAAFVKEGKNPISDGPWVIRSLIAIGETVLSNR